MYKMETEKERKIKKLKKRIENNKKALVEDRKECKKRINEKEMVIARLACDLRKLRRED